MEYEVYLTIGKGSDAHTVCEKVSASSVKEAIDKAYEQTIYMHTAITGVLVYE